MWDTKKRENGSLLCSYTEKSEKIGSLFNNSEPPLIFIIDRTCRWMLYMFLLFYFKPIQFSIRINVDIFRIYIYFFILFYIFSRASTRIIYTRSKMTVLCSNSNRFKSKSFALFFQTIRISIYNSFNIIPYWFLRLFRASSPILLQNF